MIMNAKNIKVKFFFLLHHFNYYIAYYIAKISCLYTGCIIWVFIGHKDINITNSRIYDQIALICSDSSFIVLSINCLLPNT